VQYLFSGGIKLPKYLNGHLFYLLLININLQFIISLSAYACHLHLFNINRTISSISIMTSFITRNSLISNIHLAKRSPVLIFMNVQLCIRSVHTGNNVEFDTFDMFDFVIEWNMFNSFDFVESVWRCLTPWIHTGDKVECVEFDLVASLYWV